MEITCKTHRVWSLPPDQAGGFKITASVCPLNVAAGRRLEILELRQSVAYGATWLSARVEFPEVLTHFGSTQAPPFSATWINLQKTMLNSGKRSRFAVMVME